jgi:hypothetical protein
VLELGAAAAVVLDAAAGALSDLEDELSFGDELSLDVPASVAFEAESDADGLLLELFSDASRDFFSAPLFA